MVQGEWTGVDSDSRRAGGMCLLGGFGLFPTAQCQAHLSEPRLPGMQTEWKGKGKTPKLCFEKVHMEIR